MSRHYLIMVFSFVWICSEIALARYSRLKTDKSAGRDKSSLKWLWIVIITAISLGVFIGLQRIGAVSFAFDYAPFLGLALIIAGSIIRWVAIRTLGRFFTVEVTIFDDHRLISIGIYRYVRHPAYSGSLLSFLGLGIFFSNWLSLLIIFLPIFSVFLYRMKIEERALREKFGQAYLDYSGRTARLIPGVY